MTDFLLELRSEEIPARMQLKATDDLARLFAEELAKSGLKAVGIETLVTPRRLTLIARGLPVETQSASEERKGPRANAPEQALAGFLRSTGLTREQLVERDGVFFAIIEKPGRPTAAVLAEAVPHIVRAFPWPKSMRWGAASLAPESLKWVRPLQGIVALFGEAIVPFEIDGLNSGATTLGHRFHHSGSITIGSAEDYVDKLRMCHVIVDHTERMAIIRDGATTAAVAAGLTMVPDEGLVAENAGLTEWPVPLLGRFDAEFLTVPPEVIQLTMRTNQKYFACTDAAGALANAFICTANIEASDGGAGIVAGNQKVLAARLSDAKFFWEQDLKVRLEEQAKKLSQIVFHEKLGTVADKVDRVAKLARWLVTEQIVRLPERSEGPYRAQRDHSDHNMVSLRSTVPLAPLGDAELENFAQMAETAARLCKADLVTGMVGEFPELQGVMGGYYAAAQGYDRQVSDAIRDHYKPVGQGDDVPTAPVTVAVSLADKLDTLVGFFAIGERPTGSKDPFALRRAALGALRLILDYRIRCSLNDLLGQSRLNYVNQITRSQRVIIFDDDVSDDLPVPEFALHQLTDGELYILSRDEKSQTTVVMSGRSYSAFSKNYIHNRNISFVRFDSMFHLVGSAFQYLTDRISEAQKHEGIRSDFVRSVIPVNVIFPGGEEGFSVNARKEIRGAFDDPVAIVARVKALQAFVTTSEGANLLSGYKRASNILKKEAAPPKARHPELVSGPIVPQDGTVPTEAWMLEQVQHDGASQEPLSYTPEPSEKALIDALDSAEPLATAAIAREDFEGAMAALASLRGPIDAFFETVTVNDPLAEKREARLALLARVRDAIHRVADFSKIEG